MPNCNFYAIDNDFVEILNFIFDEMECRVFESYSEYEKDLVEFSSAQEVVEHYQLTEFSNTPKRSAILMLWPVKASENVKINRIELNPKKCQGATHRYRVDGWGLISLELSIRPACNIAIPTTTRKNVLPLGNLIIVMLWGHHPSGIGKLFQAHLGS